MRGGTLMWTNGRMGARERCSGGLRAAARWLEMGSDVLELVWAVRVGRLCHGCCGCVLGLWAGGRWIDAACAGPSLARAQRTAVSPERFTPIPGHCCPFRPTPASESAAQPFPQQTVSDRTLSITRT